jgi:hypothetical protein
MTPHPTTEQTPESELRQIATAIEAWRKANGMTKTALIAKYGELGSDSTFGKCLDGRRIEELVLDKWLPQYRSAWAQIQQKRCAEPMLDDLDGVANLRELYADTRDAEDNTRFILLLGDSGSGKTTALDILMSKPNCANAIKVEVLSIWRDARGRGTAAPLLRAIARTLGIRDLPQRKEDLHNEVIAALQPQRRAILLDEAHHLCPEGLNEIKHIINLTGCTVVAAAMPTLWDRLTGTEKGYQEAKQLNLSRLAGSIWVAPTVNDFRRLLTERCPELSAQVIHQVAPALLEASARAGHVKYLVKVTRSFRRRLGEGEPPTKDTLVAAAADVKRRQATRPQ